MAITTMRNRRLGNVIPGTRPRSSDYNFGSGAGSGSSGSGVTLVNQDGGSTAGAGSLLNAQVNQAKFLAEQQAAQAAFERQRAGAEAQARFLQSQLSAGIPTTISGEITAQEAAGQKYIEDQARALGELLSGRRTQALGQVGTAYGALESYLQQNAPQAFAQAQRVQPQTVQSALSQYMAGQGVSPAVAQEAANIANVQAAGGAANFNQLLDVLAAREAAAQQSRMAEAQMGRTAATTGLEAIYGTATSQLEQQRLAALADLASRISQARLDAQTQQLARNQAIQDALASLVGTGVLAPGVVPGTEAPAQQTVQQPAAPTPVQQLAAKTANIRNQSLVNRIENFVASNPNATPAQIRRQFPSLGANITR